MLLIWFKTGNEQRNARSTYSSIRCVGYWESKYRLRISLAHPSRLSLCACAVTSSINWEATDAISLNSCYVYVCSCSLNMFKDNWRGRRLWITVGCHMFLCLHQITNRVMSQGYRWMGMCNSCTEMWSTCRRLRQQNAVTKGRLTLNAKRTGPWPLSCYCTWLCAISSVQSSQPNNSSCTV